MYQKKGVHIGIFGDILVKYNPKGICHVISFKTMKKLFPNSSSLPDDGSNAAFKVYTPMGVVEFKSCDNWFHFLDLKEGRNTKVQCAQVMSTVQRNFKRYSRKEVKQASKAKNFRG